MEGIAESIIDQADIPEERNTPLTPLESASVGMDVLIEGRAGDAVATANFRLRYV